MKFEIRKIENCFADSKSFEYTLPINGRKMLELCSDWDSRLNEKLRRPVAVLQRDGLIMKFVISDNHYRLSFPQDRWQEEKLKFEQYLEKL